MSHKMQNRKNPILAAIFTTMPNASYIFIMHYLTKFCKFTEGYLKIPDFGNFEFCLRFIFRLGSRSKTARHTSNEHNPK
jgi:hypothetical protein